MRDVDPRQYIIVAAPDVKAGIAASLRQAFRHDGARQPFDLLLARLDRIAW